MKEKRIKRYSAEKVRSLSGKTDWNRIGKLTDKEIAASIARDPDWAEFKDVDWSKAEFVVPGNKIAISIRLDADVLSYFKKTGRGYQRRMNHVLRTYIEHRRKAAG